MKICNKCGATYSDTNLFCKKCHSLLQLQKTKDDTLKLDDNEKCTKANYLKKEPNRKLNRDTAGSDKLPPNKEKTDVTASSESFIYVDWEPPAPTTIYSKIKNIPYGVLKYNLSKGLYTNGIRQIESYINNRTYCCSSCSYYTNFDCAICYLKEVKVNSNAICKSFELKPEFKVSLDSINKNEKEERNEKEKKKKTKKRKKEHRCRICSKMYYTKEGLEKHQRTKH